MFKQPLILLVAGLLHSLTQVAGDCNNIATSEGSRTLLNGETACAPLAAGETEGDKGRRFLTCSNGIIYVQDCGGSLRYDTVSKSCTWPKSSTCSLAGEVAPTSTQKVSSSPKSDATNLPTTSPKSDAPNLPTNSPNSTRKTTKTLYTTLTSRKPSTRQPGSCGPDNCKQPDCFCFGASPNKIPLMDTPMFVMLTFDDAVTSTVYNGYFKSLLVDNKYNLRNPGGCPIRAAFYINHDYTDYNYVKVLANKGNEIASHTVSHRLPPGDTNADYPEAVAEITGIRQKVFEGTGDRAISDSMTGFRSPYLLVAHDVQFDALRDNGFLYDTSITNVEIISGRPPLWPFTLDYIMPRCPNVPCPTKSYPGLWEVPINGLMGSNNYTCSMIDTCSVGSNVFTASEDEWIDFYQQNFGYFYGQKIPMHLFTHGSMFLRSPPSFDALITWFRHLQQFHKDVWIVPPKMVIEWMKHPLTNSDMIAQKWGCD